MANEFNIKSGLKLNDYTFPSTIGASGQSMIVNAGGTGLEFSASPAISATGGSATRVAVFDGTDSIEGDGNFTWSGSVLGVLGRLDLQGTGDSKAKIINTTGQDTSGNSYIEWHESNGTTRRGYVGFTDTNTFNINVLESAGTSQIILNADEVLFKSASSNYAFPAADGSPNQVLQTNGTGQLSFATPTSGVSATSGSATQVAVFDGTDSIVGTTGFIYNGGDVSIPTGNLTVSNSASSQIELHKDGESIIYFNSSTGATTYGYIAQQTSNTGMRFVQGGVIVLDTDNDGNIDIPNGIVRIQGATDSGLIIDKSLDPSPVTTMTSEQALTVIHDAPGVTHNTESLVGGATLILRTKVNGSTEPSQGYIGPSLYFAGGNDTDSGGPAGYIRLVKSEQSVGASFDGGIMVFGTRLADNGTGGATVREALRIGANRHLGVVYKPNEYANPPAMLTVGTDLTGDNTIGIRETSSTPGAISNYGQYYVKSSDNLPYFKDSSGTEYPLVTAGNARVDDFYYSVSNTVDTRPVFEDTNVLFNWDETGNDLEFQMKVAPSGSGDMRMLGSDIGLGNDNTFITTTGVNYDVYAAGVAAGNRMEAFITAEDDDTYPAYHATVYNTGETAEVVIWIRRITKN